MTLRLACINHVVGGMELDLGKSDAARAELGDRGRAS